ncbi:Isoniazid-induced protein IniB [Senna tora]|uniref:Isoniazid-induced protein IniB n=1 Tax=Senna tora TaxID=362788 RepID=A0A834WUL1_9FABA|nr:Isoniazid-induced protein IniB [Senna tora]
MNLKSSLVNVVELKMLCILIDDPPIVVPSPHTGAPSPPTVAPSPTAPYPPIAPSPPIESYPPIAPSPHSSVHSNPQHDNEEPQIDNEQPPHLSGNPSGKDPKDHKTWIYPDKKT